MAVIAPDAVAVLQERAAMVARVLKLLGNENRLLLLCHLAQHGEVTVGALAEAVGLSQPALSQHLALLREDGLLATRREAQAVYYRIADPRVGSLLDYLRQTYCSDI